MRRGALPIAVALLAMALAAPLGSAGARKLCETPPGAVTCVPFPCLYLAASAENPLDCSIGIPPCGITLPPLVEATATAPADALVCDCPSPCEIVRCLPPIESREALRCPIEVVLP